MRRFAFGGAVLLATIAGCSDDSVTAGSGGSGGEAQGGGGSGGEAPGGGGSGGGGEANCLGTESDDPEFAQALEVLREGLAAENIPGGAIAVVKDGKLVNLGVSGTKVRGACEPVTPDTLFVLPYASEILTAIAALDAVEEGKLSLTAPITDVIPLVVETGAQFTNDITLHHLLSHSSMYTTQADAQPQQSTCTSLVEAYSNPINSMIEAPPGSMSDNDDRANLELAGLALQMVDNKPFSEAVQARVLGPLGMGGTYDVAIAQAGDHSLGYVGSENGALFDCPNHYPSYGYNGSIRDYVKLAEFLTGDGEPVLESGTFEAMLAEQGPSFWSADYLTYVSQAGIMPMSGEAVLLNIGGVSAGFNQTIYLFPDHGLAVITILNQDTFLSAGIGAEIAKIYGVDPDLDVWLEGETEQDPATLQTLVGTYVDAIGVNGTGPRTLEVSLKLGDPGTLQGALTAGGGEPQAVTFDEHYSADNFVASPGNVVRFWRDDVGEPVAVQFGQYGSGAPFFRVP